MFLCALDGSKYRNSQLVKVLRLSRVLSHKWVIFITCLPYSPTHERLRNYLAKGGRKIIRVRGGGYAKTGQLHHEPKVAMVACIRTA